MIEPFKYCLFSAGITYLSPMEDLLYFIDDIAVFVSVVLILCFLQYYTFMTKLYKLYQQKELIFIM